MITILIVFLILAVPFLIRPTRRIALNVLVGLLYMLQSGFLYLTGAVPVWLMTLTNVIEIMGQWIGRLAWVVVALVLAIAAGLTFHSYIFLTFIFGLLAVMSFVFFRFFRIFPEAWKIPNWLARTFGSITLTLLLFAILCLGAGDKIAVLGAKSAWLLIFGCLFFGVLGTLAGTAGKLGRNAMQLAVVLIVASVILPRLFGPVFHLDELSIVQATNRIVSAGYEETTTDLNRAAIPQELHAKMTMGKIQELAGQFKEDELVKNRLFKKTVKLTNPDGTTEVKQLVIEPGTLVKTWNSRPKLRLNGTGEPVLEVALPDENGDFVDQSEHVFVAARKIQLQSTLYDSLIFISLSIILAGIILLLLSYRQWGWALGMLILAAVVYVILIMVVPTNQTYATPRPSNIAEITHPIEPVAAPAVAGLLNTPPEYEGIIDQNLLLHNQVPKSLVLALIQIESGWDPNAVSSQGAQGLMQLMPETAQRFNVSNSFDPTQNIAAGIAYLDELQHQFVSTELVLAAYNWGPEHVRGFRTWAEAAPHAPEETQRYVPAILALAQGRGNTGVQYASAFPNVAEPTTPVAPHIPEGLKSLPSDANSPTLLLVFNTGGSNKVFFWWVKADGGLESLGDSPPVGMSKEVKCQVGDVILLARKNGQLVIPPVVAPDKPGTTTYIPVPA